MSNSGVRSNRGLINRYKPPTYGCSTQATAQPASFIDAKEKKFHTWHSRPQKSPLSWFRSPLCPVMPSPLGIFRQSVVCQQEPFRQLLMCCKEFWDTSALSPSEQNMKMVQSWIILTLEAVHVMTICTASRETSANSDSLWLFSLLGSRKERKRLPSGLSPT